MKNGKFQASVSFCNICCIALSTIWNVGSTVAVILYLGEMKAARLFTTSEFFENASVNLMLSMILISAFSNWWILQARKHFASLLNLILEVDESLKAMKFPMNLRKHRQFVFTIVALAKTIVICLVVGPNFVPNAIRENSFSFMENSFMIIASLISIEANMFSLLHFVLWMWAIKLRYKKVNQVLALIRPTFITANDEEDRIQSIMTLHDTLVDITHLINRCYGVPMMLMLAKNFAFTTMSIYAMLKLTGMEGENILLFQFNIVMWAAIHIVVIYAVVHLGHFVKHEVRTELDCRFEIVRINFNHYRL